MRLYTYHTKGMKVPASQPPRFGAQRWRRWPARVLGINLRKVLWLAGYKAPPLQPVNHSTSKLPSVGLSSQGVGGYQGREVRERLASCHTETAQPNASLAKATGWLAHPAQGGKAITNILA